MAETKTVAERLRGITEEDVHCRADPLSIAVRGTAMQCTNLSCYECTALLVNELADEIEAEQAERIKAEHDEVDVDALLKLADELFRDSHVAKGALGEDMRHWAGRIRDAVKGANPSKSRELPEGVEWPRFEDGELVKFGDMAKVRENIGDVIEVRFHTGKCSEVTIAFEGESTATHYMVIDGPHLKRPEPEVLDADRVPIKVGDTVYHEVDGSKLTVVGFRSEKEDDEVMVDVEGQWSCVRQYSITHRKPDTWEDLRNDAEEFVKRLGDGVNATYVFTLLERQRKLMGGE